MNNEKAQELIDYIDNRTLTPELELFRVNQVRELCKDLLFARDGLIRQDEIIQQRIRPQQVIYPYPPFLLMDNGDYFEMPNILILVKMVYDLRKRVEELEAKKG